MISDFLENLKDGNRLKEYVLDYYIDHNNNNVEDLLTNMEDLQRYGCVSGMITSLIYYDDTNRFYEEYKDEINELLSNLSDGTGLSIEELFGDKFDKEDPLVLNTFNKNLLAWFGFETTSNSIYEQIYEKFKGNNYRYEY